MNSELLNRVLKAMAPNRTVESWLAGSSVVASLLLRFPNDIDVHHVQRDAFDDAIRRDTETLVCLGFVAGDFSASEFELETRFVHPHGDIAVNWVLEPTRPQYLIADPKIGVRASYGTVIDRKIEMCKRDRLGKHRDDLLCLLRNELLLRPETDIPWFRSQLAALGLINADFVTQPDHRHRRSV
ncbi:hypothetical protein [Rhizobium laguerreae]|uniref:hypothetical protein n=1 Tax=Rhizobium laguerreae TaxID=1076926 RepID=UPI0014414B35|nr:hypothetical protein [Rhizobium laguerreae]NKN09588.1 hypothetical protein [Rhizobium laguerreae]